jgi:hypothetical protein
VVRHGRGATDARAILSDAAGAMRDLNHLIDPGLSAVLQRAFAINASGQVVGVGAISGISQGFALTAID